MPFYIYSNPKTKKTIEVLQSMTEEHVYIDKDGLRWDRVFLVNQASFDTKIDPYSSKDFAAKTGTKKGTMGNLFDLSKECSIKREEREGIDMVKERNMDDYQKKRANKMVHPERKKKKAQEAFSKLGVDVTI